MSKFGVFVVFLLVYNKINMLKIPKLKPSRVVFLSLCSFKPVYKNINNFDSFLGY